MINVKIYGMRNCPYCVQAKMFFSNKDVELEYQEVPEKEIQELSKETGIDTVPQIFVNYAFIGGWVTVKGLIESGELDKLLNKAHSKK